MAPQVSAKPTTEPTLDQIPPKQSYQSADEFALSLMKQHPDMPLEHVYKLVQASQPMRTAHNQEVMDQLKIEVEVEKARDMAEERVRKGQPKPAAGEKDTTNEKDAIVAVGGDGGKPMSQQSPKVQKDAGKLLRDILTKKGGTNVNISMGGGAPLSEGAKVDAARQFNKTGVLPPLYRDYASRKEIMNMAADLRRSEGDTGDLPTERASFKADVSSLNQRQKFVDAGNQFIKNMTKQADLVEKYMKAGTAGQSPALNRWVQGGRKAIEGDADVTALDTAIRGLAREHQRIVTGVTSNAQLHQAAQETADQLLNINQNEGQMRASMQVMREEAKNAVDSGKEEVSDIKARMTSKPKGGEDATPDKVVHWDDLK